MQVSEFFEPMVCFTEPQQSPLASCKAASRPVQPLPSELPPPVEARVTLSYVPRLVGISFQQTKALGWPPGRARKDGVSRHGRWQTAGTQRRNRYTSLAQTAQRRSH